MVQREMPFLNQAAAPELLEDDLIRTCRDGHEAILLCFDHRRVRYTQNEVAALCGIDKGHFACILGGTKHLPSRKRTKFMEVCGNFAPLQFEAFTLGCSISFTKKNIDRRIQALEEELTALRRMHG